jgi:positive regulator of sigma E activity
MIEKAIIISSREKFAQVKIDSKEELCHSCSARSLCVGNQQENGTITVLNSLSAQPGDEVKISIPEGSYNKGLIILFGALLLISLLGLSFGYLAALLLALPSSQISLIGFLVGLLSGGFLLSRYFRRINKKRLYPSIIEIMKKGDPYG